MKKLIFPSLFIALFFACTSKSVENGKDKSEPLERTITFAFSDTVRLDTFRIALIGKNTDEMQMHFTITSYQGKEIYKQEIKASELLKNYIATAELKKEADKLKFLKEEIAYFFDERHFLEPAVTENESPDKNVPDLAFYQELKKSNLNGFEYRLAKDHNVYIAWSVKEQKVKIYYKCC
ncbi:hypothetical protein [Pedobacter helvus]|uniref:Lipoprotein n=1 Tax=Pedobacter helvus TaxID=2563444 RepID=A0ABW9JDV2_9SPHI|nr:hypothetical protein [Pedobacter ureilyticus]